MSEVKGERLQVALARHGIASRRGVVELIEAGEVTVNGAVVREKGFRVDASKDKIAVKGRSLDPGDPGRVYYVFHKPKGVMTTLQDPHAERTVADFFKDVSARVFPVGRLDRDTTGLLLVTNDGETAFRLTHPKFKVEKEYHAVVRGAVPQPVIDRMEKGVDLEGERTAPCTIRVQERTAKETNLFVVLSEGKKRQIRRLFEQAGHPVKKLQRLSFGPLKLGDLPPGQKRELTRPELKALRAATGQE